MAIAETAQLITQLSLRDQLTPGLAKARAELSGFSTVSGGASNALNTFKGRIGGLLGVAGIAGLGAGLFSIEQLMKGGIDQAVSFGNEVYKLQAVTGLSADKTSELASVFHHFGIESDTALRIAALGEKNLFAQGETAKKAAAFFQTYGFNLRDASGHLKDFNTLLLDEADYFNNKAIPAATKDAELAKIFGRNWQSLIPVLQAGRTAISDAEVEAKNLGLTLTGQNLKDLAKLRGATRDWSTALGGLKLQIGLALVPALTDLAKAATNFLKNGGREQIVNFFKQLIGFGRQAAAVITNQVIPVFKGIWDAWNKVPKELRDLLITGLVANKTIKFLFGVSPLDIGKGLLGGIGGQFFARGSPGNPMWVTAVGGFGGGGAGGPGGGLGALLAGPALPYIAAAAAAAGVAWLLINHPGHDPSTVHPGLNPITGARQGGFDRTAGYGLRGPVPVGDAAVKASILAEGAKQSSWRASSQAALARIGVTSLAGNASMNRIQGAVARSAILQSSKLDRLNQLNGVTAGNTGVIARKRTSVSVTAQVNVASTNTFNVNSLATSLVSTYTRVNVGNQYQGKIVPI